MYLHIGKNVLVSYDQIIGIFDFDQVASNKRAKKYLQDAEKEHVVIMATDDIPKSFLVCTHPFHKQIVYLSQLNTSTLLKRIESGSLE